MALGWHLDFQMAGTAAATKKSLRTPPFKGKMEDKLQFLVLLCVSVYPSPPLPSSVFSFVSLSQLPRFCQVKPAKLTPAMTLTPRASKYFQFPDFYSLPSPTKAGVGLRVWKCIILCKSPLRPEGEMCILIF